MKLAIVIHAEEEFDWHNGFNRHNNQVTHHIELQRTLQQLLSLGLKLTLAVDFAFLSHPNGRSVLNYLQLNYPEQVEYASHLHPWVTPPFSEVDRVGNVAPFDSFPGNLSYELEKQKLSNLTEKLDEVVGKKPKVYLAGRYGIGVNSYQILADLGYQFDISPCPYFSFQEEGGPDFTHLATHPYYQNKIKVIPHTTAFISPHRKLASLFYCDPERFQKYENHALLRWILKLGRIKRLRLSADVVELNELKKIVAMEHYLGREQLIFSLHSSSLKRGTTSFSHQNFDGKKVATNTLKFVQWWLQNNKQGSCFISEL